MDILKNITLVTTVYVRRSTLPRLLNYYGNLPCKVIICDSSPDEGLDPVLSQFGNVEYLRYPNWPYHQKLYDALKRVKTKYYLEVPDDDFVLVDGIRECIGFLEKNPHFAAAMGQWGIFENEFGVRIRSKYTLQYLRSLEEPLSAETAAERVGRMLANFIAWNHSVQRTEAARFAWQKISEDHHLAEVAFVDYVPSWSMALHGSLKILHHGIRSREKYVKGESEIRARIRSFNFCQSANSKDLYVKRASNHFLKAMGEMLVAKGSIAESEARAVVEKAFKTHCEVSANWTSAYGDVMSQRRLSKCQSRICPEYGCAREKMKPRDSKTGFRLVSQTEDGECLADAIADLPLFDEKYTQELSKISKLILKYPVQEDADMRARYSKIRRRLSLSLRKSLQSLDSAQGEV